jgi:RHS repeat-associated protein
MKFSELTLWFPVAVTIPLGNSSNKLSPPAAETPGLLPIKFGVPGLIASRPGRTAVGTAEPKAFVVRGWRGSALVWKLDGKTATAPAAVSAAAPKCAAVIPPQITTEDRSYDGDGTLTSVKVTAPNGTTRSWNKTWDPTRGNQEILSWSEGTARTSFVYGLERATAITAGVTTSFGYTPLGDAVDGAAGTVASGEYGPYGTTGTAPSGFAPGFGYRGELHLGDRVHLRARDLDTRTGRFDRVDPLPGSMAEVVETNEYHYANNDPTNQTDPSGLHPSDATFAVENRTPSGMPGQIGQGSPKSYRITVTPDGTLLPIVDTERFPEGSSTVDPGADGTSKRDPSGIVKNLQKDIANTQYCERNKTDYHCAQYFYIARRASNASQAFESFLVNNRPGISNVLRAAMVNAYRHCLFSGTLCWRMGQHRAAEFLNRHEEVSTDLRDSRADSLNNLIGLQIGSAESAIMLNSAEQGISLHCIEALNLGRLTMNLGSG